MAKSMVFGVRSDDIDEASRWFEEVTGISAEARDSSFWGGEYFVFNIAESDRAMLFLNKDIHDDEAILDEASGWDLVVLVEFEDKIPDFVGSLESQSNRFRRLDAASK